MNVFQNVLQTFFLNSIKDCIFLIFSFVKILNHVNFVNNNETLYYCLENIYICKNIFFILYTSINFVRFSIFFVHKTLSLKYQIMRCLECQKNISNI